MSGDTPRQQLERDDHEDYDDSHEVGVIEQDEHLFDNDSDQTEDLVDNEELEADDSASDNNLDDSESDDSEFEDSEIEDSEFDDAPLDQLDALITDESAEDDLEPLGDDLGADIAAEMVEKLEKLERPGKSKPAQAAKSSEARRAIEARAEQRRIDRDLNYLDFELDD